MDKETALAEAIMQELDRETYDLKLSRKDEEATYTVYYDAWKTLKAAGTYNSKEIHSIIGALVMDDLDRGRIDGALLLAGIEMHDAPDVDMEEVTATMLSRFALLAGTEADTFVHCSFEG